MATGPIDYLGAYPQINLAQSLNSGLQLGMTIDQIQAQRAAQQAAKQQAKQYQADIGAALKNPTPTAFAGLALKYPSQREAFKQGWDQLSEGDRKEEGGTMAQAYSALLAGSPDVAQSVIQKQIDARKNSGLDTSSYDTALQLVKNNPKGAQAMLGFTLSHVLDPKEFASSFAALEKTRREQELHPTAVNTAVLGESKAASEATKAAAEADVAERTRNADVLRKTLENQNISGQIADRAARLKLDTDRLTSDIEAKVLDLQQKRGTLPDSAVKIVNDAAGAAIAADQSAVQSLDLADKLDRLGGGSGVGTTIAEKWAAATGRQDALSAARQEYVRLRNNAAVKSLPPGPATDKDIELALKGFPADNSDSKYIASFLRGMAKLQQRESAYENARSEWVNSTGSMGSAKSDIEVDGVRVPKGQTFVQYARQFLDAKTKERAGAQDAQRLQSRSYMRFAKPGGQ